jgi:glutaredoxin 3
MALAARELVRRLVSQHGVVVFSKTYCPYCMDAKSVLKSAAPNFTSGLASNNMLVLELDRRDDEREIQVSKCSCMPMQTCICRTGMFLVCFE